MFRNDYFIFISVAGVCLVIILVFIELIKISTYFIIIRCKHTYQYTKSQILYLTELLVNKQHFMSRSKFLQF
jgi:hypothetical protein